MKQRITKKQLQQLTTEQEDRLRELWEPRIGNSVKYKFDDGVLFINIYANDNNIVLTRGNERIRVSKSDCLPLLSIGQCLEIIEANSCYLVTNNEKGNNTYDIIKYSKWEGRHDSFVIEGIEIIDTLWEAVKQSL